MSREPASAIGRRGGGCRRSERWTPTVPSAFVFPYHSRLRKSAVAVSLHDFYDNNPGRRAIGITGLSARDTLMTDPSHDMWSSTTRWRSAADVILGQEEARAEAIRGVSVHGPGEAIRGVNMHGAVRADARARDLITRANTRMQDYIARAAASNARVADMNARIAASNARVAGMNARVGAANDRFVRADQQTRDVMIRGALAFSPTPSELAVQAEAAASAARASLGLPMWSAAGGTTLVDRWRFARAAAASAGALMPILDVDTVLAFRELMRPASPAEHPARRLREQPAPAVEPVPEPTAFRETETGISVPEAASAPAPANARPSGFTVLPEEPADRAEKLLVALDVIKAQMGDVIVALNEQRDQNASERARHEAEYAELRSLIEAGRPSRLKRFSVGLFVIFAGICADRVSERMPLPIVGKIARPPAEVGQPMNITIKPTIVLIRPPPRRRCGRPRPRRGCHRR